MSKTIKPVVREAPKIDLRMRDLVKTFNTPHGIRVLEDLENNIYKWCRIDARPTDTEPNPAYVNPNAALYRSAQLDLIQRIKRDLKRHGVDIRSLEPVSEKKLTD